jgi:hypothetical protein
MVANGVPKNFSFIHILVMYVCFEFLSFFCMDWRISSATFNRPTEIATYVRNNHSNEKINKNLPFKCEICNKSFNNQHGLNVHKNIKHKMKIKTATHSPDISFCPNCGCNIRIVAQAMAAVKGLINES